MARLGGICSPIRVVILVAVLTVIIISTASHPRFPYELPYKVVSNNAYYGDYADTGAIWRPPRKPALAGDVKASVHNPTCSPEMWSAGSWIRKANPVQIKTPQDALTASGFEACAWQHKHWWFLANDKPEMYEWRTNASAYDWVAPGCEDVSKDFAVALVQDLVEQGGWYFVGDSLSEQHFFSISCVLSPYLTPLRENADAHRTHHLHLNPDSPIIEMIHFPPGFNISSTPLLSVRRGDLMMSKEEITKLFNADTQFQFNHGPDFNIWGEEDVYTTSPEEYFAEWLSPLPKGNYKAIIISVGGHFSTRLFWGLQWRHFNVFEMFDVIARAMIARTMDVLDSPEGLGKEFIYRPYLPGHDACQEPRVRNRPPLDDVEHEARGHYNWEWIPLYNRIMRQTIEDANHPRIHYLNIERPGRLRPETHVLGDCLHLTIGTGVMEGWTRYIHYFLRS